MATQITAWPVVRYAGARNPQSHPAMWTHADIGEKLGTPRIWTRPKITAPAWSPVQMVEPGARRAASNVAALSMLVLDCDAGEPIDRLIRFGDQHIRIGHTSWSHTAEHPKARLVFPFASLCPVEHWGAVWGAAARWAASEGVTVDAAAKDPSRLYFGPFVACFEGFRSWAYDDIAKRHRAPDPGALPRRARSFLSWARLVERFPERAPEPYLVPAAAGYVHASNDQHERRRRRFAVGMVRYRCEAMIAAGEGGRGARTGRNARTFALARLVSRLVLAGCLDQGEGIAMVEAAAGAAGLKPAEYRRAIRNGLAAGVADGPEDVDQMLTERS